MSAKKCGVSLRVEFDYGSEQVIDFKPVLYGEMWGPLQDLSLFNQVELDPVAHTLSWPNGADFLTEMGLKSYSQKVDEQLEISTIRKGSIELLFVEVISHIHDATPLAVLWLFLKYLPKLSDTSLEINGNLFSSFRDLPEEYVAKESRKHIRAQLKQDDLLVNLDARRLNQLAFLLDNLYSRETRLLPAAQRFAQKNVKVVSIRIKDRDDPILQLGKDPVFESVQDASNNHDCYVYDK